MMEPILITDREVLCWKCGEPGNLVDGNCSHCKTTPYRGRVPTPNHAYATLVILVVALVITGVYIVGKMLLGGGHR